MLKKIKDITKEEALKLCESTNCDKCPYKLVEVKLKFNNAYPEDPEHRTYDGYSYCICNLAQFLESEIEVPDEKAKKW